MSDEIKLLEYTPTETSSSDEEVQACVADQKETLASGQCGDGNIDEIAQTCVVPHSKGPDSSPKKPNSENCNLSSLTVTVEKNTTIINSNDKGDALEIVGGYKDKEKEIKCKLNLTAGPCGKHSNKTFDVRMTKQSSNTDLSFKAPSIPFYKIFDNGTIFPWNAKTSSYIINANTCGGSISKNVVVYPDVEMSIDIPLDFSKSSETTEKVTNSEKNAHIHTKETKEYKITAKYKEDGHELSISPSINKKFKNIKDFQAIADNAFGTLQKAFDETIKIAFAYPVGKIHFDFAWKEKKEVFKVGSEWSAQVNIDPLIGATLTVELDEAILKLCTGPIGAFYTKVKKALARFHIEVKFEFIVSGSLKIVSGLNKEAEQDSEIKGGGGVTGKIEADLKASAEMHLHIIVSVDATAEAGVKTGIEGTGGIYRAGEHLNLDLNLHFLGVKFYASYSFGGGPIKRDTDTSVTVGETNWPKTIELT